MLTERKI